jgi:hypothetical protein
MQVRVSPYVPKRQRVRLSETCPCSPEVLRDFNAWLLNMFGADDVVYFVGGTIVISPQTYEQLRREAGL